MDTVHKRMFVDLAPLRDNPDFRALYLGRSISLFGSALTTVAVIWQLYELTHSPLVIGLNSLCTSCATVVGLLKGGVLADRMDRRRVLIATRVPQTVVAALLFANSLLDHPAVWSIIVLCAAIGLFGGLGGAASTSAVPVLVGSAQMPAAAALIGISSQIGAIGGPAAAGALVAGPGVPTCFAIDTLSFALFSLLLSRIRPLPPAGPKHSAGDLAALRDGFRFVRRHRLIACVLLVDANAMVFGMPEALFPAIATQHFGGGATTFGLMAAAPAAGAVVAAAASGWTGRTSRPGVWVIAATVVWGLAIVFFGLADELALALAFLMVAGMADVISEVLRSSLLQNNIPDAVRGRVTSMWLAQTTAAPGLGNAEAGAVAGLFGVTASVVSGGLACVAGALVVAVFLPQLRNATLSPAANSDLAAAEPDVTPAEPGDAATDDGPSAGATPPAAGSP